MEKAKKNLGSLLDSQIRYIETKREIERKRKEEESAQTRSGAELLKEETTILIEQATLAAREALGDQKVLTFVNARAKDGQIRNGDYGEVRYCPNILVLHDTNPPHINRNNESKIIIITEKNVLGAEQIVESAGQKPLSDQIIPEIGSSIALKVVQPSAPEGRITVQNAIVVVCRLKSEQPYGILFEVCDEPDILVHHILQGMQTAEQIVIALAKTTDSGPNFVD
ncbi:MAG: hypothetical protein WCT19_00075 [Candidatus Paceibacterota bacterium]